MGIRIKGEYEILELEPNRYLLARTLSGIETVVEFAFEAVAEGTLLIVTADYTLPGAILGGTTNRLTLEQQIERDTRAALDQLKIMLEDG
jgi:hypothetical protein